MSGLIYICQCFVFHSVILIQWDVQRLRYMWPALPLQSIRTAVYVWVCCVSMIGFVSEHMTDWSGLLYGTIEFAL